MRDRFRTFDSRVSFFAFADIITAVCGVLIFITLLLATDLTRPTISSSTGSDPALAQKLSDTLRRQSETDARNRQLQELLAAATTAPSADKLQADISRLTTQLADEKTKQAALGEQVAHTASAAESRDRALGFTGMKSQIRQINQEAESLDRDTTALHEKQIALQQKVNAAQVRLAKLRQQQDLWIFPDRSATAKEPIVVTVNNGGAKVERFNRPDQTKNFSGADTRNGFKTALEELKPAEQYVVFLVSPSGIGLFEKLAESARAKSFEIGYEPLLPGRETHFTTRPADNETDIPRQSSNPAPPRAAANSGGSAPAGTTAPTRSNQATTNSVASTNAAGQQPPPPPPPPPPVPKSWWQRFLEFIGLGK